MVEKPVNTLNCDSGFPDILTFNGKGYKLIGTMGPKAQILDKEWHMLIQE